MCSTITKKYKENSFFPSKLFLTFEKFPNNSEENSYENSISKCETNFSSQNETIRQFLTKELLDTINFSILNETNERNNTLNFNNDLKNSLNPSFHFFLNKNMAFNSNSIINNEGFSQMKKVKKKKKKNKKNFEEREGDWNCYFCRNLNFTFRKKCNKCGIFKYYSDKFHDKFMENVLSIINDNQKRRKENSSFT